MIAAMATAGLVRAATATMLLILAIGCGVDDDEVASVGDRATILIDEATSIA